MLICGIDFGGALRRRGWKAAAGIAAPRHIMTASAAKSRWRNANAIMARYDGEFAAMLKTNRRFCDTFVGKASDDISMILYFDEICK